MYTNILVPFDGSDSARRALSTAIELGTKNGQESADITVLQVAAMTDFDYSSFEVAARMAGLGSIDEKQVESLAENYISASKEHMQEQVSKYFESLPENIGIKIVVKRGNPRDIICNYANENDIDCIVMGRRGVSGIRAALGSVSTAVLRGTDLPVLVVK